MGVHRVTLIPGDGMGPEMIGAARRVLEGTGVAFDWDVQDAGLTALDARGTPLPAQVLESIKRNRVALKGSVTTPSGFRSINLLLRNGLGLFACLRPCKSYPGVQSNFTKVDLVIVRENTEDVYVGVGFQKGSEGAQRVIQLAMDKGAGEIPPDSSIDIKFTSVTGSRRIARWAFEYARANGRRKVSAVHKANMIKHGDGLFLKSASEIAPDYPDIEFEDVLVDNLCMMMVRSPALYDVLLLPNMFGDIVSDLAAGMVGGLSLSPGGSFGDGGVALFEPNVGSDPKHAELNRVTASATILSGMMMLRHLGERDAADRLERAFATVVAEGRQVTCDLKPGPEDHPPATPLQFADAIISRMATP